MKKLILIGSLLTLSACGSLTDPNSANRWVDEATYKHYPNLSEAKRAECREKGEIHFWGTRSGNGPDRFFFEKTRRESAEIYEACMES